MKTLLQFSPGDSVRVVDFAEGANLREIALDRGVADKIIVENDPCESH